MEAIRDLNDYESMLATSTCNVGMKLTLPKISNEFVEAKLREAWSRTVDSRTLLQVRLVAKEGQMGPLGQRYGLAVIKGESTSDLFVIETSEGELPLIQKLQHLGTSALDITKGSYFVHCTVQNDENERKVIQLALSCIE